MMYSPSSVIFTHLLYLLLSFIYVILLLQALIFLHFKYTFFYFLFQYNQIIEIYSPFSWNFARTISTFFPLERYSKPQIIIHIFSYLILFLRLFFFFFFFGGRCRAGRI